MSSEHVYETGTSEAMGQSDERGGAGSCPAASVMGLVLPLVGGSLLGGALLWLLGTESGRRQSARLGEGIGDAYDAVSDSVAHAADAAREGLARAGSYAAEKAGRIGMHAGHASEAAYDAVGDRAADWYDRAAGDAADAGDWLGRRYAKVRRQAGRQASDAYGSLSRQGGRASSAAARAYGAAGDWLSSRGGQERGSDEGVPLAASLAGAVCVAAAGAALMYFFDPSRGTRRRHHLRDKTGRYYRNTRRSVRHTAGYTRNHARGLVAEARRMVTSEEPITDEKLIARVRSELGHQADNAGAIDVAAHDGRITLTGSIPADRADAIIACVRAVRGVREVENKMNVTDAAQPT